MVGRFVLALAAWACCGGFGLAQEALQSFSGCSFVPTEWADGDSFRVRFPDGEERTVRLYGADCIEAHVRDESDARRLRAQRRYFGIASIKADESVALAKEYGRKAADFTASALAQPFTVHTAFADGRGDARYARVYAFVTTADGDDLAAALVENGLARAFGVNRSAPDGITAAEYRDHLTDLELVAASERRGVWSRTNWKSLANERLQQRLDDAEIERTLSPGIPERGVDPNTASRDELMTLPGVGEVMATRIIEARSAGPYSSAADLSRVRGLGPSAIEKLAPSLRFTAADSRKKSSGN
ncbi:MAG: helix-hairpin-helix domain-containing protein [Terrimicrobiaceae bacterium]|nr:helix-hairpin-helix domain-containing protein [Terrimicrobiaceae bacterium]